MPMTRRRCLASVLEFAMHRIHANGIGTACHVARHADAGRPWLVFAHSLASDHSMWQPQLAAFGADFSLLAYDLRGHGGSDAPPGPYPLELLADDLAALLDACGIARCHFVGLSLGGMVGQMAALRHPARFASLTLADTTSRQPPGAQAVWDERLATVRAQGMAPLVEPTLERWFTPAFRAARPEEVARIGALIRATPVAGYAGCAHSVVHMDLTDQLHRITCPVLVIVGRDDAGTPPSMAETIARAIPGARLVVLEYAAHLSNIEQADAFNAALQDFLPRR
jgi:3-oxoadipate enol-lactonase